MKTQFAGFQSTLPRRERQPITASNPGFHIFQSTLPRRERRDTSGSFTVACNISIHAPAKGATSSTLFCLRTLFNFNPRSREGSDNDFSTAITLTSHFNPRSREGSDLVFLPCLSPPAISIHAPAKGATTGAWWQKCGAGFQSTLPRRERRR